MTGQTPHDDQVVTDTEADAEQAAEIAALLERAIQAAIAELDKSEHCAGVATGSVRDHDVRVAVEAAAKVLLRARDATIRQQSAAIEGVTRRAGRMWDQLTARDAEIERLKTELADARDTLIDAWHDGHGDGKQLHEYLGMTWEEYGRWVGPTKSADQTVTGTTGDPA